MARRIVAFVIAVVAMTVLGSVAHSYFVQEAWVGAASAEEVAALDMSARLAWAWQDVIGMQPLYAGLITVALLIAFLAAGLLARFVPMRTIIFAGAGAVAVFVLFTVMKEVLGTVGVFGARGVAGLGAQMLCGLVAGFIFARPSAPSAG